MILKHVLLLAVLITSVFCCAGALVVRFGIVTGHTHVVFSEVPKEGVAGEKTRSDVSHGIHTHSHGEGVHTHYHVHGRETHHSHHSSIRSSSEQEKSDGITERQTGGESIPHIHISLGGRDTTIEFPGGFAIEDLLTEWGNLWTSAKATAAQLASQRQVRAPRPISWLSSRVHQLPMVIKLLHQTLATCIHLEIASSGSYLEFRILYQPHISSPEGKPPQ